MSIEYTRIRLAMFGFGVNCYLLKAGEGYILIDAGFSSARSKLDKALAEAGCSVGKLKLVVLTHGDSDHAGNANFLRLKYGTSIAMHQADAGMVEQGNSLHGRKEPPAFLKVTTRLLRLSKADRFSPDLFLEDSQRLDEYGLAAKVLHLPGHSAGSIAVLTDDGTLFAGDLVTAMGKPIVCDAEAYRQSVDRVKGLSVHTLCPGHGEPKKPEVYMG